MKNKLLGIFRGNDIIIRIYLCFATVLALTAVMIGVIFLQLYQNNYLRSYTSILTQQGHKISKRVTRFYQKDKLTQFQKYCDYIDEMESAEVTDVWIVRNRDSQEPLPVDYTNADDNSLTKEMNEVLQQAYQGKVASSSSFDKVYGMVILRVALPIYVSSDSDRVCGAVMMVSMLDRQRMGVKEGKYLITLSAALGLLISFVVSVGFSRYLSRPLARIDNDIMRLADGDYRELKIGRKKTQLGRLEMALDGLAARLRKLQEEQQNLDRVRQDFFANVSHELRTPITVIRGYAESLADGVISDPDMVQDFEDRMVQECQGMERLVGDLFILSKMQNPDFQIEKEPVSLIQVFSDVTRNAHVLGQEKDIQIDTSFPEDDPCLMMGDYDRLRQMFMVIVDNAIKFSKEHSTIDIVITKEEGRLQIDIQDYGVGISGEQLPYIFEKFYKSKLKQNEKGTGLGLMIAKQIALRHDGDIRVQSEPGQGSVFSFSFLECSVEDAEMQMG